MRSIALLAPLVLLFAGCQTVSNKLPLEQIVDLRVGEVSVTIADGAQVPADARNVIGPKIKAAMERQLSPRLKGSMPVRVEVNVRSVTVSSDVQRILIGGNHGMVADVELVDSRTKAVILAYPAQSIYVGAGQGVGGALLDRALLPDPLDRIADGFAFQYAEWLRPSDPRS